MRKEEGSEGRGRGNGGKDGGGVTAGKEGRRTGQKSELGRVRGIGERFPV